MPIVVRLDVELAKRKMSLTELSEYDDLTIVGTNNVAGSPYCVAAVCAQTAVISSSGRDTRSISRR